MNDLNVQAFIQTIDDNKTYIAYFLITYGGNPPKLIVSNEFAVSKSTKVFFPTKFANIGTHMNVRDNSIKIAVLESENGHGERSLGGTSWKTYGYELLVDSRYVADRDQYVGGSYES